jgi:hypothetical protein
MNAPTSKRPRVPRRNTPEEHDHRVDEQERRAHRAEVIQSIGDHADGRDHHWDGQAGIASAPVQSGTEHEVERGDGYERDTGRDGEGLRCHGSRQDADAQKRNHDRRGPGGDQIAAKTDSLFLIVA